MRQQRQGTGLVRRRRFGATRSGSEISQQHFDEAVFDVEPGPPGRPGDRAAQFLFGHWPDQHLVALQRGHQLRITEGMRVEVGPEPDDDERRGQAVPAPEVGASETGSAP